MVFLYLRKQDNGEESKIPPGATAFLVMDNKVARQVMAENGGKMVENGRELISAVIW